MRELQIGQTIINDNSDCFVIAEIGHNHQGNLETCKSMFKAAKEAGASAVKIQKRDNKFLYTKDFYNSPYNSENAYAPTYGEHRDFLEFGEAEYQELKRYAAELDIIFFATPFDVHSVEFMEKLDTPMYKTASAELTNIPFLEYVAKKGKPMIISTGAATMEDVERAYNAVTAINKNVALLQCTATYPTPPEVINLRVLETYRKKFPDAVVGLSTHFSGIVMGPVMYTLGGRIIEQHFTINRAMKGTDQAFSLEPVGLSKMIRDMKRTRLALGDGKKVLLDAEIPASIKMAKKIVAAKNLPAGHVLTEADLAFKSPGDGLKPYHAQELYGKTLKVPLQEDEELSLDHV
ncbi:MAG: N-acetylneuraminate synthase family protein [Patescibacteria group bacterium]|jgi:N-acetylneuraminate synthase/sialic acid synthase